MTAFRPKILSKGPQTLACYINHSGCEDTVLKLRESHRDGKLKLALKFKHNSKDTAGRNKGESVFKWLEVCDVMWSHGGG